MVLTFQPQTKSTDTTILLSIKKISIASILIVAISLTIAKLYQPGCAEELWTIENDSLAIFYQSPETYRGQTVRITLRLQKISSKTQSVYFYDNAGHSIRLQASRLYYNDKILRNFKHQAESVYYYIEFEYLGLDNSGIAYGNLLNLSRTTLQHF